MIQHVYILASQSLVEGAWSFLSKQFIVEITSRSLVLLRHCICCEPFGFTEPITYKTSPPLDPFRVWVRQVRHKEQEGLFSFYFAGRTTESGPNGPKVVPFESSCKSLSTHTYYSRARAVVWPQEVLELREPSQEQRI